MARVGKGWHPRTLEITSFPVQASQAINTVGQPAWLR